MAEYYEKIKLDVDSNMSKIARDIKDTTEGLGKLIKLTQAADKAAANASKERIKALREELRLMQQQEAATKRRLEYDKKVADINRSAQNIADAYSALKSGGVGGLIRNRTNNAISSGLQNRLNKIGGDYNNRIANINKNRNAELLTNEAVYNMNKGRIESMADKQMGAIWSKRGLTQTAKEMQVSEIIRKRDASLSKMEKNFNKKQSDVNAEYNAQADTAAGEKDVAAAKANWKAMLVKIAADIVLGSIRKTLETIQSVFTNTLGISLSIRDNFNAIVNEIGAIMNMQSGAATYSTSSSLITNAKARTTQLKYGLSESQNYALARTMGMMNMQGDEDLMYMNREQVQLFRSFMDKYDTWYQEMQSTGALQRIQEFQLDFAMFKQEIAMSFMEWFAENKDTILGALKTISTVILKIAEAVMKIAARFGWRAASALNFDSLGGGHMSSAMSDYASYSANNSRTININVKQNNNATGVLSNQKAMEQFFGDQMQKLSQDLATEIVK